ncbi:MAG: patatin-like phospholipase family protein, partial [Rhodothermales bacterium]|nr:patatin-like phospholipase family protein [Rhodothermales bacterium]
MSAPLFFSPEPGAAGPRRALVLAGGGMRVAYQAGVLRAFAEEGLRFAHADGASGGTINLAMLFSGLSPAEMCARWRTLDVKAFASLLPLRDYASFRPGALGDADGLVEDVFPHLGIDVEVIRQAEGMAGTFNVCNFTRKTVEPIPHEALTLDLLVAAVSLPLFMPVVEHGGALYTDAVWIKDANCWEAVRRGAEEVWLVWCIGNTDAYADGFFEQYVHTIEMSANGALFEEFDRIRALNERIEAGDSPFGQRRPVRLHVVRPEHPLPLDPDFFFGRVTAAELIAHGYADARAYLRARTADGLPFTPDATRMSTPGPGITFRETMSGPFALGEADPEPGRRAGDADGHTLALHATITIDDLDRFEADPAHTGTIHGEIDFTPFGTALPTEAGVFNLFAPADEPGLKRMVYEVGFRHDGEDYYLAGHKDVRDDPGPD